MRLGRPIRHRLLTVAVLGLVTAGLSADALYRAISVTRAQRLERGREAVRDEIDRMVVEGAGTPAGLSPIIGMRGGLAAGPKRIEAIGSSVPPQWRMVLRALAGRAGRTASPVEIEAEIDGGQLVARMAPRAPDRLLWAAVLVRPSPTLQSWRLLVVALAFSALLLVASASYSLVTVKRAAGGLRSALAALADDLTAPVPRSSVRELDDIAIGIDTLARRLEESRRIQEGMVRDLARQERLAALGRVVAGVAHEVRNPLASIKLRLDLAARRDTTLPEVTRAAIDHASSEIMRLDRLVADLLIVAGRAVGTRAPLDLAALLRARSEALRPWAALRRIAIDVHGQGTAVGDADALARAIDNVLRNAIEASPDGAVVEASVEEDGDGLRVRIADRGEGVTPGRAGEIFEPFFTTKPDGTGLGLAISRAIARAHGGELVYRREGEVTYLELTLPAGAAAEPIAAASAHLRTAAGPS
ncbi:MAG TPA: HAMP domain-containing sensor histidine kinase [Polyangia bacterium]|nr:HAMP domain-containing sensor histidine kinase [Polyangia bacterium]